MKSYNVAPYYDDFAEENGFHQILFKPGVAVQSRELSQMQTILRNQIEKFGNHIFSHGSVVIPGNSIGELGVPYVKLNSDITNISDFEGKTVVGGTTGIKAYVRKALKATESDPATLYLSYLNGNLDGDVVFKETETLTVVSNTIINTTTAGTSATGLGSLALINAGVYYVNGNFVYVEPQSIVISKYDTVPNCRVLLKIQESIVDSSIDETLLDPAQGSYNYAAPGADRVKIRLELTKLSLSDPITSDFIEIMRYESGVLSEHVRVTKYSELEKSLARRTFDESGNYVVTGLQTAIREHFKDTTYGSAINGGVDVNGSRNNYVALVSAGKAYISGFEVEKISTTSIVLPKARTDDHVKNKTINLRPSYGQYIIVSTFTGTFSSYNRQTISIWNDNDSTNVSATQIGTAKIMGVDHLDGPAGNGGVYKLWLYDISITSPYSLEDAGGIRYTGGGATVCSAYYVPVTAAGDFSAGEIVSYGGGTRVATVKYWNRDTGTLYAFKHDHTKAAPKINDYIVGAAANGTVKSKDIIVSVGQTNMVFQLPLESIKALKNSSNTFNITYNVQKELTITTDSSGNGSISIPDGTVESIETGNFVAISSAGALSPSLFSLPTSNSISVTGGTANTTIKVYPVVKKTLAPKTKTRRNATETIAYSSTITLGVVDVYKINRITYVSGGSEVVDVTDKFDLITGQTDFAYTKSQIKIKSGYSIGSVNLTIQYSYYEHSAGGDYFSVDSYAASGIDHLDQSYPFVSPSNGYKYNLKNCIDFRPSVGADGSFTGANSRRNDLIVPEYLLTTDIQYFVPRIDIVFMNKDGNISVRQGIPSEYPTLPRLGVGEFSLDRIYVPAFTEKITDIRKARVAVTRSTMKDISSIKDRISRLEEAYTLTAAENNLLSFDVVDAATGQSRYKTGYLVEDFNIPFTIADTFNPAYRASFDRKTLTAAFDSTICELQLNTADSSNYSKTNYCVMLPYTERTLAEQPYSSRVTNLNPFLVISWVGNMTVSPAADHWVEIVDLPTIFNETTETILVNSRGTTIASSPNGQTWNFWTRNGSLVQFNFDGTPDNPVSTTESISQSFVDQLGIALGSFDVQNGVQSFSVSMNDITGVSLGALGISNDVAQSFAVSMNDIAGISLGTLGDNGFGNDGWGSDSGWGSDNHGFGNDGFGSDSGGFGGGFGGDSGGFGGGTGGMGD